MMHRFLQTILVPIDFSDLAVDVIQMATNLAKAFNGSIRLVHVVSPQYPYYVGLEMSTEIIQDIEAEDMHKIENDLKAMELFIQQKDIEVSSVLLEGKKVSAIIEESERIEADLIVIGSETLGLFSRTFLGSVSEGVLRKASCPVLIVQERESQG
ncbi:MAG TPA: universal stress protein [Bacteroidales bacterium]|nr:universal stress protein [Bacteroidales bacterium]HNS47524.1 universal stress protein [Bacteroidales bacterium]